MNDRSNDIMTAMVMLSLRGFKVGLTYSRSNGFILKLTKADENVSYSFAVDNVLEKLNELIEADDVNSVIEKTIGVIPKPSESTSVYVSAATSYDPSWLVSSGTSTSVSSSYFSQPPNRQEYYRFDREPDGRISTNVHHYATIHSPTGFEWGYNGSGPTDLAINIVHDSLLRTGYKGVVSPKYGIYAWAIDLGPEFRDEFIARISRSKGGKLPHDIVDDWVKSKANLGGLS